MPLLHFRYRCCFFIPGIFIFAFFCVVVAVVVTAKYSRNLICNDRGWDGTCFGNWKAQLSRTQFDKTTARYARWLVLSPPSVHFDENFPPNCAYKGKLAWSLLRTVEIRFGFSAYSGKSIWSFVLTVPPAPEIWFGLSFAYSPPTVSKKDEL